MNKMQQIEYAYRGMEHQYMLQKELYDIRKPDGYVYIIQLADTDIFKIGISIDPDRRLKQLQSRCPIPLKIIYSWLGHDYRFFEFALHKKYKAQRVKGEWFRLSQEDLMWLSDTYPNISKYDMAFEYLAKN